MLTKIKRWFIQYDTEICWFFTGWFGAWFLVDLGNANWFGAAVDAVIVVTNLAFRKG